MIDGRFREVRTAGARALVAAALAVVFGLLALACTGDAPQPAATSASFEPAADTYVSAARPRKRYGRGAWLKVDRRPLRRAYLRFRVSLPQGAVVRGASLRLYATSRRGAASLSVFALARSRWRERRMSFRSAPTLGARLGRTRGWRRRGWQQVALPARAIRPGSNSFAIATTSRRATSFHSRESVRKPRLVVSYSLSSAERRPGPAPGETTPGGAWERARAGDILVPAFGALFGGWHKPTPSSSWTTGEFERWEGVIGRKVDIDHHFVNWGGTWWPGASVMWDNQKGRHPMLSIGGDAEFPGLDAVNNGSQDAWIAGRAEAIKALDFKVFLRPLWEMNGDWGMPWHGVANGGSSGPAKYVAAWRRIVGIFRQRGAGNAIWVWSPNCDSQPNDPWNHFSAYYPGDSFVDWVACDGYNRGTSQAWSSWRSWASVFGTNWDGRPSVYAAYPSKPFMVAETASCEQGGDKGAWISQARADIKASFPNLKAFVWFDEHKECDWRAESSAGALAAFRAMAADPYFNP
jgi:mannan endo-1,4-beta-mannosidase